MTSKAVELKLDIEDLNNLLQQATRQRSKDILTVEIRKLQTELGDLTEENKATPTKSTANAASNAPQKCYEVKLNNYGWDQTNTTVKLYITLTNVHTLPKEAVSCNFTENTMELHVLGLDNKNYNLPINNLCEEIDVEKSYFKIKTDMIVVSLAKKVAKNWSHVTGIEKRITKSKEPIKPDMDSDGDPFSSLMNVMKNMYNSGDDEMKRTIAKAWTDSQQRKEDSLLDLP